MNGHYLHLLVNHAALWSAVFGVVFLLLGLTRKSPANRRAGQSLLLLGAIFTIVSVQSGEAAEEVVEHLPSYERTTDAGRANRRLIHEHEEAGEAAQLVAIGVGVISLAGLWLAGRRTDRVVTYTEWATLLLAFLLVGSLGRASQLGGQVRRPELRDDAVHTVHRDDD